MARLPRVVVPDHPHHVTQRGNRREPVFLQPEDYALYLGLLDKYTRKHGLAIWAYCLMPNHVHLVAVPSKPESLACALRDTHTVYALALNRREELSGHLWQGRFYSTVMDETHCWTAIRYVERNPVHAGLVRRAEDYRWSSAAAHCGLRPDALLDRRLVAGDKIPDWSAWLAGEEPRAAVDYLRHQTRTGRPCGPQAFVTRLEQALKRPLVPHRRGRKPARGKAPQK